ncbi:hypothetical protein H6S82_10515 [Planktothrix sp. FACHB-1355]|uniref:Uncharacterized protein n=1 Tax=Aerosakkonema funiforme FACHB-1375 TaxID=2949571 RepID=A0A926ZHA5_9CYAN|nr:hypothetical protein [Aerosakkonema funiforme]MBD2183068.1 hypothetical protein [Aerosakkonema funiforme FACHB-1375]MBD3559293.1 hypothetical protein [Planktothrix sp. FACHB-1355]
MVNFVDSTDANALVTEHLELCNYKVSGYWDEKDEFYEEITLPRSLSAEVISSSIGVTDREEWIQLKFVLKADKLASEDKPSHGEVEKKIGEVILIYDKNMEFIDENWQIDIESPFVIVISCPIASVA